MINRHLRSLAVALQGVDPDAPRLQSWGTTAVPVLLAGGRLLACGTGGSAEQAQHLAARLARGEDDRPPFAVVALSAETDPATAACREDTLAGQVRALGRAGDILLCVSASGADREVIAAAAAAAEVGMRTWALTGPAPNPVAAACADAVTVSTAAASTVQEVHLAAIHIFCAAVDSAVRDAVRAGERAVPAQERQPSLGAPAVTAH